MTDSRKIPATVITGFLGAGKTSAIRHILATVDLELRAATWPAEPITFGLFGKTITFAAPARATASTISPTLGFILSPPSMQMEAPMPLSVNMRRIPSPAAIATTATSLLATLVGSATGSGA